MRALADTTVAGRARRGEPEISARASALTALVELGRMLGSLGYEFASVTPRTHALVNARRGNDVAWSLRDVFGWSRPFTPEILPAGLFECMLAAEACEPLPGMPFWRPKVRFSSLAGSLFAHSAFPTREANAVFFGPDTHRFVRALEQHRVAAERVVDIGCGSGAAGIALARRGRSAAPVVLADVNDQALRLAGVNAALSDVSAELVHSDVLEAVEGTFDLVISNPPYLLDDHKRLYRDGGGEKGEAIAVRIVRESLARLRKMPAGGTLLLYTGSAIVDGRDVFLSRVRSDLARPGLSYSYEELDPDVFSEELERPAYADVERIAAVFLQVRVAASGS